MQILLLMIRLVGGKPYGQYGDFQKEVDMINRNELMLEGDVLGRGLPSLYPLTILPRMLIFLILR